MKPLIFLLFVTAFSTLVAAQDCLTNAKVPDQQVPESVRLEYSRNLEIAARNYAAEPTADNLIWYARRKGYLGKYKDAIESLTIGIGKFPNDARMYRHRGHRFITIRCFDDAIRDLEQAAKLIKGKPDEVEPDGLPNAKNITTSTLQSNIWYHLGLAYYLKGDFKRAQKAYEECTIVSKNPDMLAATVYWHYMTLRRMGKKGDAAKVLGRFDTDVEVIENDDYLKLLKLNKGEAKAEGLLATIGGEAKTLGSASLGYGIGNYFFYNGDRTKAVDVFRKIVTGGQWASFGYIAAEADLARLGK
ncbi:MAG: tetratricopeptide repeat protein [Acidobacteria bacterium]|nr:tetratricopeptide repeat protein [Acidobacteriota bacterium]